MPARFKPADFSECCRLPPSFASGFSGRASDRVPAGGAHGVSRTSSLPGILGLQGRALITHRFKAKPVSRKQHHVVDLARVHGYRASLSQSSMHDFDGPRLVRKYPLELQLKLAFFAQQLIQVAV